MSVTSFRFVGARYQGQARAVGTGNPGQQLGQFFAQRGQAGDLCVHLVEALAQHGPCWLTGALAGVADLQEVANLAQPQAQALHSADEPQPVDDLAAVASVITSSARGRDEQAAAFVPAAPSR